MGGLQFLRFFLCYQSHTSVLGTDGCFRSVLTLHDCKLQISDCTASFLPSMSQVWFMKYFHEELIMLQMLLINSPY